MWKNTDILKTKHLCPFKSHSFPAWLPMYNHFVEFCGNITSLHFLTVLPFIYSIHKTIVLFCMFPNLKWVKSYCTCDFVVCIVFVEFIHANVCNYIYLFTLLYSFCGNTITYISYVDRHMGSFYFRNHVIGTIMYINMKFFRYTLRVFVRAKNNPSSLLISIPLPTQLYQLTF